MLDFVAEGEEEMEEKRRMKFSFLLSNLLYLPNLWRCRLKKTNGRSACFQYYRQKVNRASFGKTKARYWLEERADESVCSRVMRGKAQI